MKILYLITVLFLMMITPVVFAAGRSSSIAYTDIGSGKPIVLIHAFPTDQRLWKLQQEGLKNDFRIVTLDLRGFGESEPTDGGAVSMTDYADDVKAVLDKLHIQKAVIGGESMGGYIALAFLKKYPEAVEGLILSDTQSLADTAEAKAKREVNARDVLDHGTANLIKGFMGKALSPDASEATKAYLQTILETQPATALASALRGMALRADTSELLAHTKIPVLIITGDQDVIISPQQSADMHALAKNSQLVTIKNAGHLASLEKPEEWNQAVINSFLRVNSSFYRSSPLER